MSDEKKRPGVDTIGGKIWAHADRMSTELCAKGDVRPVTKDELLPVCLAEGINEGTAASQYSRWRAYWGLPAGTKGRKAKADAPPPPPPAPPAPVQAPPKAEALVAKACATAAKAVELEAKCLLHVGSFFEDWDPIVGFDNAWIRKLPGVLYGVGSDNTPTVLILARDIVLVMPEVSENMLSGPYEVLDGGYTGYCVGVAGERFVSTRPIIRRVPICDSKEALSGVVVRIAGIKVSGSGYYFTQENKIDDINVSPTRWTQLTYRPSMTAASPPAAAPVQAAPPPPPAPPAPVQAPPAPNYEDVNGNDDNFYVDVESDDDID